MKKNSSMTVVLLQILVLMSKLLRMGVKGKTWINRPTVESADYQASKTNKWPTVRRLWRSSENVPSAFRAEKS